MADNFVWIKNETLLVNLDAIAYLRFGDDPASEMKSEPAIIFRNLPLSESIFLEPDEAQQLQTLLKGTFGLGKSGKPIGAR
jgi:hypothetical protein